MSSILQHFSADVKRVGLAPATAAQLRLAGQASQSADASCSRLPQQLKATARQSQSEFQSRIPSSEAKFPNRTAGSGLGQERKDEIPRQISILCRNIHVTVISRTALFY